MAPPNRSSDYEVTEHDGEFGVKKVTPFVSDGQGNLIRQEEISTRDNQTNGTQKSQIVDGDGDVSSVDNFSKALVEMDSPHHEIHDGKSFDMTVDTSGTSLIIALQTGDGFPHMTFDWKTEESATFTMWKGATWTGGTGSALTPLNQNHNSSNTSLIEGDSTGSFVANSAVLNPTGLDTGSATEIFKESVWATNQAPANTGQGSREERILATDETYVFQITASSGGLFLHLDWYEL